MLYLYVCQYTRISLILRLHAQAYFKYKPLPAISWFLNISVMFWGLKIPINESTTVNWQETNINGDNSRYDTVRRPLH